MAQNKKFEVDLRAWHAMSAKEQVATIAFAAKQGLTFTLTTSVPTKSEAKPSVAKPTKSEAKPSKKPTKSGAEWFAEKTAYNAAHGLTPENVAKYNALLAERFSADWAVWTASDAYKNAKHSTRKVLNHAKAVEIRNTYRVACGISHFEKA